MNPAEPSMPGPRRRTSIVAIVVLVVVGLTLSLLAIAGSVWYSAFRQQEMRELRSLNLALAEQAATALALPMWNVDKAQIRKATESLLKVSSVQAVVVREPLTRRLVLTLSRDANGEPKSIEGEVPRQGIRVEEQQVVFSGEVIGSVEVILTTSIVEARLGGIRAALCVFILVVALLLSGALYLVLWKIALHPIRQLEQYSLRVNDGTSASPAFGPGRFHGELDSLRESIVKMVTLLDARYLALREETRRHQASEERFRTLVNTIPDLVWLKDVDGVYLACNRMFERLFGATESEIVGKTDHDFVPAELADLFRGYDRKAIATDKPTRNEEWVVFADGGERVLLETVKTPMRDSEGNLLGVLGVGRDITARHRADEERRILDERVNNMQKLEALGVLVAGVAHNINNVLAAIMGTASFRGETTRDQADREAYDVVVTACRRGRDVVKSLMQFSRPTLSNQAPVELHALLSEVRVLLSNTTRNRVRVLESFVDEPLWIHGDAGSISNSFMNLCINAMDAMPDGGTITLRTRRPEAGWIEVAVEDTGEGMAPEILARVMEPFFTTKDVGKGTGLGLSMTHGVIKAHGGTLEIASTRGSGTTVTVRLPRIGGPAQDASSSTTTSRRGPMRILLVDDDDDIRVLVARMLKAEGHVVELASDGQMALDVLAAGDIPDLVVMDQNMPGMDGVHTMARMREIYPTLPILISSGQPDIQEWDCFRAPHVAVLSKPFDTRELFAKLSQLGIT